MRFLETIRVDERRVFNLEFHNLRLNRTRRDFFSNISDIDLKEYIKNPPESGLWRCRVVYSREIESVEYIPYTPKRFESFKVVSSNVDYSYKYLNRKRLDNLRANATGFSDVIIEKEGFLTDTTIANIAFFDGESWITPKSPLLRGTFREKMIAQNRVVLKNIKSEDLKHFLSFALMNAMIGFQVQKEIFIELDDKERVWF